MGWAEASGGGGLVGRRGVEQLNKEIEKDSAMNPSAIVFLQQLVLVTPGDQNLRGEEQ